LSVELSLVSVSDSSLVSFFDSLSLETRSLPQITGFQAIIILYMSEICPRKIRGALVSGYQFAITIGLMLAAIVVNFTKDRSDTGQFRIPIGIQFAWGLM
jgi:hypothetical protein